MGVFGWTTTAYVNLHLRPVTPERRGECVCWGTIIIHSRQMQSLAAVFHSPLTGLP